MTSGLFVCLSYNITKTYLYNFDPLKPHFYIVKLGFTGVYIIFLISARKHRLWVLVEAVLTSTNNLCFEQKYEKYQNFSADNFHFLVVKFSVYLNRRVFVMNITIFYNMNILNNYFCKATEQICPILVKRLFNLGKANSK